jgi:hypothetical protein
MLRRFSDAAVSRVSGKHPAFMKRARDDEIA